MASNVNRTTASGQQPAEMFEDDVKVQIISDRVDREFLIQDLLYDNTFWRTFGDEWRGKRWTWIHIPTLRKNWILDLFRQLELKGIFSDFTYRGDVDVIKQSLFDRGLIDNTTLFDKMPDCRLIAFTLPYFQTEIESSWNTKLQATLQRLQNISRRISPHDTTQVELIVPNSLDQSIWSKSRQTTTLDRDQEIYRYCRYPRTHNLVEEPRMLMIFELKGWVIDDILITAALQPLTHESDLFTKAQKKVRDAVNDHLDLGSVIHKLLQLYQLTIQDPCYQGPKDNVLAIYEQGIFNRTRDQLQHYFSLHDINSSDEERINVVAQEIGSLRVILDIRNELSLILNIVEAQGDIIDDILNSPIFTHRNFDPREIKDDSVKFCQQIESLTTEAGILEASLNRLLDLNLQMSALRASVNIKKITNDISTLAKEADKRATEAETQSTVLFVFTVVTVVFTPLSFVAAFFAIPSQDFPHDDDGVKWSRKEIGWGLGISEIITIILIGILTSAFLWNERRKNNLRNNAEENQSVAARVSPNLDQAV